VSLQLSSIHIYSNASAQLSTSALLSRPPQARSLSRLLTLLGVHAPGGRGFSSAPPKASMQEAAKKLLRQAKVRYHPDKVQAGDLREKVRAEEISKILNSWDLTNP
jgi:hypothetical protein